MSDSDIMSFLTYQNAGGMNTDFTSVKSALKWDPIYYSRTANASYGIGLAAVILNDAFANLSIVSGSEPFAFSIIFVITVLWRSVRWKSALPTYLSLA